MAEDHLDQTSEDVVTGFDVTEDGIEVRRHDGTTETVAFGATSDEGAIGYTTGSGGAVVQGTSKSTGVTIDDPNGKITTHGAQLNAATSVSFTVTCAAVDADDTVDVNIVSGASAGSYFVQVDAVAAGSFRVHLRNVSAGNLTETLVLHYAVVKGVAA